MTYFLPLPLQGVGTVDVEALGSYVTRLARVHCISAGLLLSLLAKKYSPSDPAPRRLFSISASTTGLATFVRPTLSTARLVEMLTKATGREELRCGTFLAISDYPRLHEFFARTFRWCPDCVAQWHSNEEVAYFKLMWHVRSVTKCGTHDRFLRMKCEACGSEQKFSVPARRSGDCCKCGSPLVAKEKDSLSPYDRWSSDDPKVIGRHLARLVELIGSDPTLLFPTDGVRESIKALEYVGRLSIQDLASRFHGYRSRKRPDFRATPTLHGLQQIADEANVDVLDLLTGETNFNFEFPWKKGDVPQDVRHRIRRSEQEASILLARALSVADTEEVPSFKAIAAKIGTSTGFLRHRFPDFTRRITKLRRMWRRRWQREMRLQARLGATKYFRKCTRAQSRAIPSRKAALRSLRSTTGLPKHLLRAEINAVWSMLSNGDS